MTGERRVAWGLLAAGFIADKFAEAVLASDSGQLAAVASTNSDRAARLAARHEIPAVHATYEALLNDPTVDAVYVSTPHSLHAEWTIAATQAGKHVLCEKPFALNQAQALAMVQSARDAGVFLMEAFMFRLHPQIVRLAELVRDGVIGKVRLVDVTMSFWASDQDAPRLVDHSLGGGAILDVGCYCVSVARLIAGASTGVPNIEPDDVTGLALIAPRQRVDHFALGSMRFPDDVYAHLSCGIRLADDNRIRIFGEHGMIDLQEPCWVSFEPERCDIVVSRRGHATEVIDAAGDRPLMTYEVDHVAAHIPAQQSQILTWDETLANMRTLDRWRAAVGLSYDAERTGSVGA